MFTQAYDRILSNIECSSLLEIKVHLDDVPIVCLFNWLIEYLHFTEFSNVLLPSLIDFNFNSKIDVPTVNPTQSYVPLIIYFPQVGDHYSQLLI